MEIKLIEIENIAPYDNNPRLNKDSVDYVANSIREFGFKQPIVIDKNNVIVAGHTRYKAAQQLGIEKVPCLVAKDLSEEQIKAYRLADNKVGENSKWDRTLLNIELDSIDLDMGSFGFFNKKIEKETFQELKGEVYSEVGDLWLLGDHRLLCGDSLKQENIDIVLNGKKADMLFTDPPYFIDYNGGKLKRKGILNDKLPPNEQKEFLDRTNKIIKDNVDGSFYITFNALRIYEYYESMKRVGLKWNQQIIWLKNNKKITGKDYNPIYEPIIYGKNGKSNFYGSASREKDVIKVQQDNGETEIIETGDKVTIQKGEHFYEIKRVKKAANPILIKGNGSIKFVHGNNDVWYFAKPQKSKYHPTQKPIGLIAKAIENSTIENDTVMDIFGGGGSTLITCEQLNRKCAMTELDPYNIDVIVNRFHKLRKSEKITLIRNGKEIKLEDTNIIKGA